MCLCDGKFVEFVGEQHSVLYLVLGREGRKCSLNNGADM